MEQEKSCQLGDAHTSKSRPIRLLIDGRKLGDGGIGVYIENAIIGLLQSGGVDITVIGSPYYDKAPSWLSAVDWIASDARQYSFKEYFILARGIDFSKFDIFHAPHYTLPFGIPLPSVVTVHDLIHLSHPQSFYYPWVAKRLIASAVRRASVIIAVSEDTRRGIMAQFGVSSEKIVCIPNAISPYLIEEGGMFRVRNTDAPYFVSVLSNTKPHKGIDDLLEAYSLFRRGFVGRHGADQCPKLLLVGYGAEELISKQGVSVEQFRNAGIEIRGAVASETLQQLYRGAQALVVPSFAEGFCLPAIEAQSLGTRVVCRPVGALKELVANDDIVASDFSVEALARSMHQSCVHSNASMEARKQNLERFSLSSISERLCALYEQTIRG